MELGEDSLANDAPATNRHENRRRDIRTVLITLGVLFVLIGLGLFWFSLRIGAIDTYSVIVLLSEDRMGREVLADFGYTSWLKPSERIRPFVHSPKSFEDCKILRYRRGTKTNWLFRYTHYEAEYLMPDGSLVIGPAFGPRPYTAPNFLLLGIIIAAGLIPLIIGIAMRPVKAIKTET